MSKHRISQLVLVLATASALAWLIGQTPSGSDGARALDLPSAPAKAVAPAAEELPAAASHAPEPPVDALITQRQLVPVPAPAEVYTEPDAVPVDLDEPINPPLDPVELGDCKLQLDLYDLATGEALGAMVNLWRIGAPQNEHWTVGDQLQQPLQVPREGLTVENLPRGVYRAYFPGARRGAPALAEFEVRGEWTSQRLPVDLPRKREIFLQLYDESGVRIDQVSARESTRSRRLERPRPSWQTKRVLRSGQAFLDIGGFGGGYSGFSHRPFRQLKSTQDGFIVGDFAEDSRTVRYSQNINLKQSEAVQSKVSFAIEDRIGSSLIFAAPFVSAERLLSSVHYPDGRPVSIDDGKVHVEVIAVPIDPDSAPDAWRSAEIKLWVTIPGYRRQIYMATLEEYVAADHRLVLETPQGD